MRFEIGDAVVTDSGLHGFVVAKEHVLDVWLYTLRVDHSFSGTVTLNENRLIKKHISAGVCECGAETLFGKDTFLHSSIMPCPKYRGEL